MARTLRDPMSAASRPSVSASPPPPAALPENTRVWLPGVAVPPALLARGRTVVAWRREAPEWARPYADAADWPEPPAPEESARWAIDFPPGYDDAAAARTGAAWRKFRAAGAALPRHGDAAKLRIALAKHARVFAAPLRGAHAGAWRWLDSAILPGRGLLVLARDDEFLAAVAASGWPRAWSAATGAAPSLRAWRSFPFPWAPDTPRGALTRAQDERRDDVVRAFRAGTGEELDAAVARAYGWSATPEADAAAPKLRALHAQRAALTAAGAADAAGT